MDENVVEGGKKNRKYVDASIVQCNEEALRCGGDGGYGDAAAGGEWLMAVWVMVITLLSYISESIDATFCLFPRVRVVVRAL